MSGGAEQALEQALKQVAKRGACTADIDPLLVQKLLGQGLVRRDGARLVPTVAGRSRLRRMQLDRNQTAQPRALESVILDEGVGGRRSVVRNRDESPLARLRRTRGRGGKPLIDDAEFAAGERFRADYTRAHIIPRVTANWSAAIAGRNRGGGGVGDMSDAALDARRRVEQALAAVGPDFAGVLVDFCCFLKGIGEIERDRSWPSRSAKVIIRLALASLARHYGFSQTARGRAGSAPVRHWGADDYRPSISGGAGADESP